ncbi:MAG: NUDIX domain-containing protein [Actinobacteria bacterium]|nr:NUDIX domain-containing protein [Actinomycetota bacterium]
MKFTTKPATPDFPAHFHVAVDVVALTIKRNLLQVAVVQRKGSQSCILDKKTGLVSEVSREPFDYALPGGHVEWQGESLVAAACRELFEETAIRVKPDDLIQIGAYGDVGRDPRPGRTISIAYVAFSPDFASPFAGSDAANAQFMDVIEVLAAPNRMEFDHSQIIRDAISRVRELMERTPIALKFCDEEFTLSDLRHVYEVMFHHAYNPDADTLRYADRIRREDVNSESKMAEQQIHVLSKAFRESSQNESMMSMPMNDMPMGLSSGRRMTRDQDVYSKVQKLLAEEYRRTSRLSSAGEKSAREKMRLSFDAANFARKAELIEGFIEKIPGKTRPSSSGTGKPAQVFRRGKAEKLDPPLIIPRRATKPAKRTTK